MPTAAELDARNLLTTAPGRQLVPGERFDLVFAKSGLFGLGPYSPERLEARLQESPDWYVVPNYATRDGTAIGARVVVRQGRQDRTILQAAAPFRDFVPRIGDAHLKLRYVLPGNLAGRPDEAVQTLDDAGRTGSSDPFGLENFFRSLRESAVSAGRWLVIVGVVALAIVVAIKWRARG